MRIKEEVVILVSMEVKKAALAQQYARTSIF